MTVLLMSTKGEKRETESKLESNQMTFPTAAFQMVPMFHSSNSSLAIVIRIAAPILPGKIKSEKKKKNGWDRTSLRFLADSQAGITAQQGELFPPLPPPRWTPIFQISARHSGERERMMGRRSLQLQKEWWVMSGGRSQAHAASGSTGTSNSPCVSGKMCLAYHLKRSPFTLCSGSKGTSLTWGRTQSKYILEMVVYNCLHKASLKGWEVIGLLSPVWLCVLQVQTETHFHPSKQTTPISFSVMNVV